MNYENAFKSIEEYEKMSNEELQQQIEPIIKRYYSKEIAEKVGCTPANLSRFTGKKFAKEKYRVPYTLYIKIMKYGNDGSFTRRHSLEERKESVRKYQHKYYKTVTQPKRREKARLKRMEKEGS